MTAVPSKVNLPVLWLLLLGALVALGYEPVTTRVCPGVAAGDDGGDGEPTLEVTLGEA